MSQQVTVRLPEELVEFIDRRVAQGEATSRAAVVATAVDRERRREIAERDAAILAAARGADPDGFDDLARYAAGTPLGDVE
jgi:Arc/MetJ-type ribon-helix-helix transcriptional regulator